MCLYTLAFSHFSTPRRRFKPNSKEDATIIFRDAAIYNMTDAGHVWIVTEQALFSNNTPVGTLGLKLNNDNETEHIRVSCTVTFLRMICDVCEA